jgi:hypothetical protein
VSTSSSIQVESSDSGMEQSIYERLEWEAAKKHEYGKAVVSGGRPERSKRNPILQRIFKFSKLKNIKIIIS